MGLPTEFKTLRKYSFQEVQCPEAWYIPKRSSLWCSISKLECHLSFLHVSCLRRGYTLHWGASHDILHLYLDKTDTNIHHYFFNIQWISYSKVHIPHRFYPPTERFGGYSDESGICPFVRPPIRMPVRPLTLSCPLNNLNTVWNILMIHQSYVEQVMTMCRVQKWELSLYYFLSYLPFDTFLWIFVSTL